MATIIDTLIVQLGLDPSKFTEGQKKAVAELKKTRESAEVTGKELQTRGKQGAEFFTQLTQKALSFFGVVGSATALVNFFKNTVLTEAATGRLAKSLGISTETLTIWQGAAKRVGGTAEDAASSIQSIVQGFQQFTLFGTSAAIPYFRALGVALTDTEGRMRPVSAILMEIGDRLKEMAPERAFAIGQGLGLTPGMIQLLLQEKTALKAYLDEAERSNKITQEQAKSSQALTEQWEKNLQTLQGFGRGAVNALKPLLSLLMTIDEIRFSVLGRILDKLGDIKDRYLDFIFGIVAPYKPGQSDEDRLQQWLEGQSGASAPRGTAAPAPKASGARTPSPAGFMGGMTGYKSDARVKDRIQILQEELIENPNDVELRRAIADEERRLSRQARIDPALAMGARAAVAGNTTMNTRTSTAEVNIGEIHINGAQDPKATGREVVKQVRNFGLAAQANTGLN
jgi:hypothetical protein